MLVTVLYGVHKVQLGQIALSKIIEDIKSGVYSQSVFRCRQIKIEKGKKAYQTAKLNLICFTPSGRFGQQFRKDKNGDKRPIPPTKQGLLEYNGIVVLDYDGIDDIFEFMALGEKLRGCKYTHVCFASPSGEGYKVFVKTTNKDPEKHSEAFKAVSAYYQELTGIADDKSSNNINRLCFVSVDHNIYYKEDSMSYEFQPKLFTEVPKEVTKPTTEESVSYDCLDDITKAINRIERNGYKFIEGQRHEYRKQFSIECVKYGVDKGDCLNFVETNLVTVETDVKKALNLVEWAYTNITEVGIYRSWTKENSGTRKKSTAANEYVAELYQAEEDQAYKIELPELDAVQISELEGKLQKEIQHQKMVETALKKHFDFRINVLKNREEYKMKSWKEFKEMDKIEYNSISRALKLHGVSCNPGKLESIVLSHFSKQVHPLKEMFEQCGKELGEDQTDYIKQVASLVKTDAPKDLFFNVFKKWLVACVANVFVEGYCTNHHCIILCGGQGTNKTTFFTSLFSSEYVFTGHVDLKNKDSMILLTDTFLVVLDEQFSVLSKETEWEALKSAVTMPRIKARWHYAKTSKLAPRIANFCGSANRIEILQDDTGNRRFIPFRLTEPVDLNKLHKIDLRKLWGQAYRLYKEGWYYLPSVKEKNQIDHYQQGFKKLSNEHYLIMDLYEPMPMDGTEQDYYSSTEIWKNLSKNYTLSKEVTVSKIGRAMRFLGFVQKSFDRDGNGKKGRYWVVKRL